MSEHAKHSKTNTFAKNPLVRFYESYFPTVVFSQYSTLNVGTNDTTSILATGSYLDYIKTATIVGSVSSVGISVEIISSDFGNLTFEVVASGTIQDYTVTFVDGIGTEYTVILHALNITVYTPNNAPLGVDEVLWENKTGDCSLVGNTGLGFIQKPSATSGWNGQGTFQGALANREFELKFKVNRLTASSSYGMMGMNIVTTTSSYSDIDFAFYIQNNNNIYCYENGSAQGSLGTISNDTTEFIIKRVDAGGGLYNIEYYLDGSLVRTKLNATSVAMIFDCSLYRSINLYDITLTVYN